MARPEGRRARAPHLKAPSGPILERSSRPEDQPPRLQPRYTGEVNVQTIAESETGGNAGRKKLDQSNFSRPNAQESEALTLADVETFEAARHAVVHLKRNFDAFVAICKAVARAQEIADARGGGKTFMRLIEQQGLSNVITKKTTASEYERIAPHLTEVLKWHELLPENKKLAWCSPKSVIRHCPVFNKPKPETDNPKPLSPMAKLKQSVAHLEEQNRQLREQVKRAPMWRDDAPAAAPAPVAAPASVAEPEKTISGIRIEYTAAPREVATALIRKFSTAKAREIADALQVALAERSEPETSPVVASRWKSTGTGAGMPDLPDFMDRNRTTGPAA